MKINHRKHLTGYLKKDRDFHDPFFVYKEFGPFFTFGWLLQLNVSGFSLKANEKMVKKTGELIKDKGFERNNFTEISYKEYGDKNRKYD